VGLGVGAFDMVFRSWVTSAAEVTNSDIFLLEGTVVCGVVKFVADATLTDKGKGVKEVSMAL